MKKISLLFISILFFAFYNFNLQVIAKEKIEYKNPCAGIMIFKINTKKYGNKIKPFVSNELLTTQKVYDDNCFDLVVNGGFFDVKSKKGVSYVVLNNETVEDVENNINLVNWLKNQNRLENVLSRSELRILEKNKNNKLKFDIAYHNAPVKKGYTIKHSLQAGPMLAPEMDLVKEGFVIMEDDKVKFQSVDILKRRERTAIGLRGKYLYIVLFTKDHKVDANEMRDYMKNELKLKKIMAFDGGLSTSLNYKDITVGSLGKYQRKVKSFLVIEK